ncbi:hypothetical protein SCL_1327 [Sulfuricaulis limicola]|uniref:Restriction endonuclease n=1 Tax=Sulfuricaulis limicola TaxID=1620215 RepID=A0A1B4XFQ4_9GAMM|nr:hypothetical protein [Sulfuricaulis limicola]BAV33638.1 hypothetical protein SCL_1327 [Sulfuricaulis limicola]
MNIPTESFEAIYTQYSAAIAWMKNIGVKIGPGRTSHYEKIVGYWKDTYKTASAEEGKKIFPDFVSSIYEIYDFVSIYSALKEVPNGQLTSITEKLQKAVNGPINAVEETPDSTTARNFLFEASVAARAYRPDKGVTTILDAKSDTGISIDGKKIWVECKRITTTNKIESNARKASRQLEDILKRQIGSGHRGIVAFDISKILNAGDKIFVSENDTALMSSVDRMMDQFMKEFSHIWQKVYTRRNRKIIGTIVRFAFMSSSEARNILVHTQQWALNPRLGVSVSDDEIQRRLVSSL